MLFVNGERFEINNVNETTTTSVLPKISISDTVSGTAYIYVDGESSPREAQLDTMTIGFHNTLKFKVPYRYECIDRGTSARQGTYFYADGIDLTDLTGARVAGWLDSNGEMHYGGYINGVRGDITLTAVYKVAVTSNVTEISKASALITSLGITQDTAGTPVKPATAQLSVFGSDNYTYSSDAPSKIDISSSGVVSLAAGYTPPLAGETVTITVTDNDDSTLFATVNITLSCQCVLALYKDKASHDAGTSPDYTKFFGGSDGTSSSGSLYALAGSLIETNKGAQTGNTEQISDWQKTTPSSAKLSKTADIIVDGDTKVYALYSMAVTIDNGQATGKDKIAKPSTLLAQLINAGQITTQDSEGTAVMPASAQLTVTGSDGYHFDYDSTKVNVNASGVVSIASSYTPTVRGEDVTITATDNNDSTITAQCTVKICSQVVCAIYIDKATCEANGTPGYTKILDNTVDSSTSPSMNVTPYSLIGSTFETQKGKTISAWQYQSSTYAPMVKNGSWLVSGDRKIYAGWQIDGISTTEIVLWRFTDTATDREATLTRPAGSYSVDWIGADGTSISSCPISHALSGTSDVKISVTNNADLSALEDSTTPGVYHATYRVKLQSDPASFTDVPVTVKDAMYVNSSGELAFRAGKTLPADLTISSPLNGKTFNSIASNAFKNLTYLTSLTISGIDGRIYGNAFNGCSALQSVTITGSGSLGIDDGAFSNCPNLATINIYNVGSIAMNSFAGTSASSITITSTTMTKINGFSHANCGTITIPGSVTTIGSSAFAGTTFQRVNIPTSVTRFESYAFDVSSGPIYYAGTEAEWNAITKDSGNTISASRLHFNATW